MKELSKTTLSGFSFVATGQFITILLNRVYNTGRLLTRYGPCNLSEIPWLKEIIVSIVIASIAGWIGYKLEKAQNEKGKYTKIPRIQFKNFGLAILFFSVVFFGFLFIFVIREYNVRFSEISYLYRVSFLQFCGRYIPWPEILMTSLIFGIILALGFSTTEQKQENHS